MTVAGLGRVKRPSPALKIRPMSSEDDGSGGEGHSGRYSTDGVFVYDGVSVGDGLDDLDSTPPECGGTQAAVPSSTSRKYLAEIALRKIEVV